MQVVYSIAVADNVLLCQVVKIYLSSSKTSFLLISSSHYSLFPCANSGRRTQVTRKHTLLLRYLLLLLQFSQLHKNMINFARLHYCW